MELRWRLEMEIGDGDGDCDGRAGIPYMRIEDLLGLISHTVPHKSDSSNCILSQYMGISS